MIDHPPEKVVALSDKSSGLSGFLAIHSTFLGPAFGGIRMVPYPDLESCRADAERLAEAMTYKCAFHDIPGGGAKVALDGGAVKDRTAVMRAMGDIVESLKGSFYTANDTGTNPDDLDIIAERTSYVCREEVVEATASGLMHAITAACESRDKPIEGLRVAVQGLGAIGMRAAAALAGKGAYVTGADKDASLCQRAISRGINVVPTDKILDVKCDLLVPCALGGIINAETAEGLECGMVVGAANNILADTSVADLLDDRGILFVPDFVSSGGGVIHGAWLHLRGNPGTAEEIAAIYDRTRSMLDEAREKNRSPLSVAMDRIRAKFEKRAG